MVSTSQSVGAVLWKIMNIDFSKPLIRSCEFQTNFHIIHWEA
jgi:hypothetical protein